MRDLLLLDKGKNEEVNKNLDEAERKLIMELYKKWTAKFPKLEFEKISKTEADALEKIGMENISDLKINENGQVIWLNTKSAEIPKELVNLEMLYAENAKSIPKELANLVKIDAPNLTEITQFKNYPKLTTIRLKAGWYISIIGNSVNSVIITEQNRDEYGYINGKIVKCESMR